MFGRLKGYSPLRPNTIDLDGGDCDPSLHHKPYRGPKQSILVLVALILTITLNLFLGILFWKTESNHALPGGTEFAGLLKETSIPYTLEGPYSGANNRTLADELWESLDVNAGIVALPDSFVAEKQLPTAMRFPWDETKCVYFLNGYHNLHCLKKIYRALNEYDRGQAQSGAFLHVVHCLDTLRQDVLCSADDTPRYAVLDKNTPTGGGQDRQCKDWSQLEDWAKEHTACWRYINDTDVNVNQLERFKFCPEGSPYAERVRQTFPDSRQP